MAITIGADSTGAAGKTPRYPRHNRGKSIILPCTVIILPRLQFNTSFLHKNSENCCQKRFCNYKFTKMLGDVTRKIPNQLGKTTLFSTPPRRLWRLDF